MLNKNIITTFKLTLVATTLHASGQPAVITVPVADLIGSSFCKEYDIKASHTYYQTLPMCKKSKNSCPRLHQLLYNEKITILDTHKDEVLVEVPHIFIQSTRDGSKHTRYWTHRKYVVPLAQLKKRGVNPDTIPPALAYDAKHTSAHNVVTLVMPFTDPVTKRTYSAGTRFVRANKAQDTEKTISVHILHPHTLKPLITTLPRNLVLITYPKSYTAKQKLFVRILRRWAHLNQGFIPYIWGGCSYIHACTDKFYSVQKRKTANGMIEFYHWPRCTKRPYGGFDCAGMIARAAQLAGLPYYLKNSTTIVHNVRELTKNDIVEPGDIIWFPGHVLVVADTRKHTAIEARGYDHGFGKIQELPLSKLFENISTYDDLVKAHHKKQSLQRLDAKGTMIQRRPIFKILKMKSLWT